MGDLLQLRGAPSVALTALTAKGQVPIQFGRSFNFGRNFNWTPEGGIGYLLNQEFVLNSADATFNQGKATVFYALLVETGLVPDIRNYLIFRPIHFVVTDLVTRATFALVKYAVINAQQTAINRAVTVSDTFSGIAQWGFFRDELGTKAGAAAA